MVKNWKGAGDNKKAFGALFKNAFECLSHELIIAKLNAYGFSLLALKLTHDHLSKRQQRTEVNHDFSSWEEVLLVRPILFNIFLNDLFPVMKETQYTSYADVNTLYDAGNIIEGVISSLQESSEKHLKWFSDNQMQGNSGKPRNIQIGESLTESTNCEKLLNKLFKTIYKKQVIYKTASNI